MQQNDRIAVLGGGTMGPGIATSYILGGHNTCLYSRTEKTLERAKKVVDNNISLFVEEKMITQVQAEDARRSITYTTNLSAAVTGAWYVAETIVEQADAKKDLYQQLDLMLSPETIIASNTSYMDIFSLMPTRRLPYTIIAHWYAPAHILPLVEIIKNPVTLETVMETAVKLHIGCGKAAVRMEKFIPGFIVNRLQSAMTREVVYLIENGYCTAEELDLAVKTSLMPRGLLLGLVQRMDFTGLDMMANSLNNKSFAPAPAPNHPKMIFEHVDKGEFGVKSGKGFYDYSTAPYEEVLLQRDKMLLRSVTLANEFIKAPLSDNK